MLPVQVLHRDDARGLAAHDQRRPQRGLRHFALADGRLAELHRAVGCTLVDHQGLPRLHDVAPDAAILGRGIVEARTALDRVREVEPALVAVEDADVEDLGVEQVPQPVADEVAHRLDVDLRREALLEGGDDRQLGGPLVGLAQESLGLVEQAGVLEGNGQARGDGPQQANVRLGEGELVVEVLERDDTRRLAADDQRDPERRERRLALEHQPSSDGGRASRHVLVDEEGLPGVHDVPAEAVGADRRVGEPDAALDRVREVDEAVVLVEDPDVEDLRVEQVAKPIPDELVHRVDLDLCREALLDLVDDRELRRALVGLGQQPLRLGEQPGVLEGDAHGRGHRREQALGRVGVGVLLETLEGQHAEDLVADEDGDAQPGLRCRSGVDGARAGQRLVRAEPERLPGLDDPGREAGAQLEGPGLDPLPLVDLVRERDLLGGGVVRAR